MTTNQNAIDKYNFQWNYEKTRTLYLLATEGKTPQYACKLQDHVINLLGGNTKKLAGRKGYWAQAWIDWMTK